MEVLMQGLLPGDLAGRHVNAGARNCVNDMLKCNIITNWKYSVNHESGRREIYGKEVAAAWERTVKAVRAQRSGRPDPDAPPQADPADSATRAAELVAQLGADSYDKREAADRALRALGKDAAGALKAGAESRDAEVAERCQELLSALENASKRPPDPDKARFDLEVAGAFVSDPPPPPPAPAPTPGN
jgi:hypothetical protein